MSEHTKGPWEARLVGGCNCGHIRPHYNVFLSNGDQIPNLSKANANLIAAAPNMLNALRMVNDVACNLPGWWFEVDEDGESCNDILKAAIAKVEGRE
jgi:hypothetical protein